MTHADRLITDLIANRRMHHQMNPESKEFLHKNLGNESSLLNPLLAELDETAASMIAKHVA